MNCLCNPPQLAILKTCNNEKNPGRQYFSCPNLQQSAKCKLFTWVGASMPMSLAFGARSRFPSKSKKTETNKTHLRMKVNGGFEAKLLVHEFIEGPPVEIWLSIQCPTTPVVNTSGVASFSAGSPVALQAAIRCQCTTWRCERCKRSGIAHCYQ